MNESNSSARSNYAAMSLRSVGTLVDVQQTGHGFVEMERLHVFELGCPVSSQVVGELIRVPHEQQGRLR